MQALSILPSPHKFFDSDDFAFDSQSFHHDFSSKLKIDCEDEKLEQQEEGELDFSFACENRQGSRSLVTADEIFHNGEIRPLFPVFSTSSKLQGALLEEPFQGLSRKTATLDLVVEDSKEIRKKSNSTGFSKMLRFRQDLKLRSYSDGKDAFVFVNPLALVKPKKSNEAKVKNDDVNNGKHKMASPVSAHEKLYVMNRMRKESNKRRSFLPYKQQLFGFFANMNGLSRNLHSF